MYDCIILYLEAEAENISTNLKPKPFLETNIGRLAPEIRGLIFTNLLAIPPTYGGRDFRAEQVPIAGQSPISLTTFADLKASCLVVLQTCRQIYVESFPIFYASKSYYLASSQDLATFLKFGQYSQVGPRLFRVDTVTSLCLKDLVVNRPKWTPHIIDYLTSHTSTLSREELEAERTNELDLKLLFANLGEMKSLRKICLCMRVGQERQYLQFLFSIKGLRRGVIDFVDNFHWTIHSQSVLGDVWSLQYTPFPTIFYKKGKNFEPLDFQDVKIQGEVLDIDSRASDLVEDAERWVEVDIGSRNYEERLPQQQHVPVNIPAPVSENQLETPDGEGGGSPTDNGSDHGSEHLQGHLVGEVERTQRENESDLESDEPQEQREGEEDGAQIELEQDQEPGDLQEQPDESDDDSRTKSELVRKPGFQQDLTDGRDHNTQAESDSNRFLGTPQGSPSEDYTSVSTGTVREEGPEDTLAPLQIDGRNTPTVNESNQGLKGSVETPNGRLTDDQGETDHTRIPEIIPEKGNVDDLETWPTEDMQASSGISPHDYRDTQTQTEPVSSKYRNRQRAPAQPNLKPFRKPQDFAKSQSEKRMAANSFHRTTTSPVPQWSLPESSSAPMSQSPDMLLATTDNNPTLKKDRQNLPISHTRRRVPGRVRAAASMFAFLLLYILLYAELENTLCQLLALLLFVLLFFVALWSE